MKSLRFLLVRFRSNWPMIGLILIVSAVFLGAVLLLHFWKGIPFAQLTRDPIAIVRAPLYTGFLSQIGILFWSASAAVCIFSAKVLPRYPGSLEIKRFLFVSGLLTLVLDLDDVFLLHEEFFPHLGVPQKVIYIGYAGVVFFYLIRFYPIILKTEYVLLGMAFLFFGLSVTLDAFNPQDIDLHLFEDGAKLVGIVSWLAYFFCTGASAVNHSAAQQGATPGGNSAAR